MVLTKMLIFTSLDVRVIHVEPVLDMSKKVFIQALVRFCNVYGTPTPIVAEGGDVINHIDSKFHEKSVNSTIKHVKIPLYSLRFGSTW